MLAFYAFSVRRHLDGSGKPGTRLVRENLICFSFLNTLSILILTIFRLVEFSRFLPALKLSVTEAAAFAALAWRHRHLALFFSSSQWRPPKCVIFKTFTPFVSIRTPYIVPSLLVSTTIPTFFD